MYIQNAKAFLCSNLFMVLPGNILSVRWSFILHLLGISLIPIYFIALIWGNGDVEERKSSGDFYLHLSWIFIYANCFVYLYQQGEASY
jgi:NADH-quinone oxidoreductase subunit M